MKKILLCLAAAVAALSISCSPKIDRSGIANFKNTAAIQKIEGVLTAADLLADKETPSPRYTLTAYDEPLFSPYKKDMPLIPSIYLYDEVEVITCLAVAFPIVFQYNLPKTITAALAAQKVDELSIFFLPQLGKKGTTLPDPESTTPSERDSASLKPAFWIYQDFNPFKQPSTYLSLNVAMGLFQVSDESIEDQIPLESVSKFDLSLHDGRISPNNGHIHLTEEGLNYAFWSLVISNAVEGTDASGKPIVNPKKRIAAATLHWVLNQEAYDALAATLEESTHLVDLVDNLANNADFMETPAADILMNDLELLLTP